MHCYLGVDIGTTAVKAAAIDINGDLIGSSEVGIDTLRPEPGWSEQNPQAWVEATRAALAHLAGAIDGGLAEVLAIGFSGQMHGLVVLGQDEQPLRNAILWNDSRAIVEAEELNAADPDLARRLGIPATPSFVAPKWLWLCRNEPEIASATRRILLPKDYVRLKLTGVASTDVVDASGAWLLDQSRRLWSEEALSLIALEPDHLPDLRESGSVVGAVTRSASTLFGLPRGAPVVVGAGDAAAGCLGLRMFHPGQAFINIGTSAQIFVTSERHQPSPADMVHSFSHALLGRWFQMAALLNGAGVLAWAARAFGETTERMAALAAGAWGTDTPLCLPYLSGERTPHNDPYARGAFIGLTPVSDKADFAAAVLDGVALGLRDALGALLRTGASCTRIGITGGGARDPFWLKLIASALERPIEVFADSTSGAAVGAALLARSTSFPLDDLEPLTPTVRIDPDAAMSDVMRARYERFTSLYAVLKEQFKAAHTAHSA